MKSIEALPAPQKRKAFLSVFRGATFLLALVQIYATVTLSERPVEAFGLLGVVAVYTLLKIVIPFWWYQKDIVTYLVLASDVVVCASLPFFTGGLSSGFLLYSLNPVLTIALILNRRLAIAAATMMALSVFVSQLLGMRLILPVSADLRSPDEYLGTMIIYVVICVLSAILPYLINDHSLSRIQAQATMDERNRLAREMHDNLAQSVGYLKLKTRQLCDGGPLYVLTQGERDLSEMIPVIDEMYTGIRESLGLLRITTLDTASLLATVNDYIEEFGKHTGIRATFIADSKELQLSNLAELQVLRLVQEALNNVRKHAKARSVKVQFESRDSWTTMISIQDDGIGFNLTDYYNRPAKSEQFGLKVMKERVESVGGTMNINTSPGNGTYITFLIPVTREALKNGKTHQIAPG